MSEVTWNKHCGTMHPNADPEKYDPCQHRLSGGPYCYHIRNGKYCGAAERWAGHGSAGFHHFKETPCCAQTGKQEGET